MYKAAKRLIIQNPMNVPPGVTTVIVRRNVKETTRLVAQLMMLAYDMALPFTPAGYNSLSTSHTTERNFPDQLSLLLWIQEATSKRFPPSKKKPHFPPEKFFECIEKPLVSNISCLTPKKKFFSNPENFLENNMYKFFRRIPEELLQLNSKC